MRTSTMKLPVKLDLRPDGTAITGTDADGKRVHFQDLLSRGDRVATTSQLDGDDVVNVFPPYGLVVAWPAGELRVVSMREACNTLGHETDEGVCPRCERLVGAVDLTQLPHADYGAAARELAEVHAWLRREHGLEQHEVDGEWGRVSAGCDGVEGEWEEVGSTLDAIEHAERVAHMEGWCRNDVESSGAAERLARIRGLLADEVIVLSDPATTIKGIRETLGEDFDFTRWAQDLVAAYEAVGARVPARVIDAPFTLTPRGFKWFEEIPTTYGHRVQVYESSHAERPHLWLSVELTAEDAIAAHSNIEPQEARACMTVEAAARLRDQLDTAIRRHYHHDAGAPPVDTAAQQDTREALDVLQAAERAGRPEVHPGDPGWERCCTVQLVDGHYEVIRTDGEPLHHIAVEPTGALRVKRP